MLDLTAILFAQRSKPRGDEADAHIADIYGCDLASWYRRNGEAKQPFSADKLAQFAIGLGYEGSVAKTLREAGLDVRTDETVVLNGLTGHPDIVIYENDKPKLLVEIKTTELQKPKDEVSPHYAIQAAAYALAVGAPEAVVLVKHARTHAEVAYPVDPQGYAEIIMRRAVEILTDTAPGAPMPAAEPGPLAPWGCRYCGYTQCEANPDAAEVMS